jgi:hypothetical protein
MRSNKALQGFVLRGRQRQLQDLDQQATGKERWPASHDEKIELVREEIAPEARLAIFDLSVELELPHQPRRPLSPHFLYRHIRDPAPVLAAQASGKLWRTVPPVED